MADQQLPLDSEADQPSHPAMEIVRDLSLYDREYGSRIKVLAEGTKSGEYREMDEKEKAARLFLLKKGKQKQRLNVSLEFSSWMFKVQAASKRKKKVTPLSSRNL